MTSLLSSVQITHTHTHTHTHTRTHAQTLGSFFRMCAFILLLVKVRSTQSSSGVSVKTLQLCVLLVALSRTKGRGDSLTHPPVRV